MSIICIKPNKCFIHTQIPQYWTSTGPALIQYWTEALWITIGSAYIMDQYYLVRYWRTSIMVQHVTDRCWSTTGPEWNSSVMEPLWRELSRDIQRHSVGKNGGQMFVWTKGFTVAVGSRRFGSSWIIMLLDRRGTIWYGICAVLQ